MNKADVKPWSSCDLGALGGLRGVLTDIDDTLTTGGLIPMGVVAALAALRSAGLPVIAVTGRSMAWCKPIAEHMPLAAVAAENGAMVLIGNGDDAADGATGDGRSQVAVDYAQGADERARNAVRLRASAARVLRDVPGAELAQDDSGRVTDIAIDHAEFVHLDDAQIARVVALLQADGLRVTVSSIHINAGFGDHTKLSGAMMAVRRVCGRDLMQELDRWVYVGDSTNDELMFATFPLAVGVANLARCADRLACWPSYVTQHERGRGFIEVAERVLESRTTAPVMES